MNEPKGTCEAMISPGGTHFGEHAYSPTCVNWREQPQGEPRVKPPNSQLACGCFESCKGHAADLPICQLVAPPEAGEPPRRSIGDYHAKGCKLDDSHAGNCIVGSHLKAGEKPHVHGCTKLTGDVIDHSICVCKCGLIKPLGAPWPSSPPAPARADEPGGAHAHVFTCKVCGLVPAAPAGTVRESTADEYYAEHFGPAWDSNKSLITAALKDYAAQFQALAAFERKAYGIEHILRLDAEREVAQLRQERDAARENLADWMLHHSFATGHGNDIKDLLGELSWQVRELREARERAEKELGTKQHSKPDHAEELARHIVLRPHWCASLEAIAVSIDRLTCACGAELPREQRERTSPATTDEPVEQARKIMELYMFGTSENRPFNLENVAALLRTRLGEEKKP